MIAPIDKKKFCLVEGKICWIVNIDVFCLTLLKPVYLDKISLGIRSALINLEIPEVIVHQNQITLENEVELVEDSIKHIKDFVEVDKIPIIVTVGEVILII